MLLCVDLLFTVPMVLAAGREVRARTPPPGRGAHAAGGARMWRGQVVEERLLRAIEPTHVESARNGIRVDRRALPRAVLTLWLPRCRRRSRSSCACLEFRWACRASGMRCAAHVCVCVCVGGGVRER